MNDQMSYTSANSMPGKLLSEKEIFIKNNKIIPAHIQLCPTNKCNLNCSFCSCSERERGEEFEFRDLLKYIYMFKKLGTLAVTITGGGEPCCYKYLEGVIETFHTNNISVGLVSNGLLLGKVRKEVLSLLTWCRVSFSDDREVDKLLPVLENIVPEAHTDWAFSYVVTRKFNEANCKETINFANKYNFTHVRLVSDILDAENTLPLSVIGRTFLDEDFDDSKVIYQPRDKYTKGSKKCYISLLKPVLAADGWLYPCCGAQYAIEGSEGFFPEQLRMCKIKDSKEYFESQKIFDGSICDKCYYQDYNNVLGMMMETYDHKEFV